MSSAKPEYRWYPEHLAGHARYCAHPSHPAMTRCAADPAEPATMRGEPSQAWIRDNHPGSTELTTEVTTMNGKASPGYAGPTGRERPGEHWNARAIRELTAAVPPQETVPYSDLIARITDLAAGGIYEPGQYSARGGLRAGEVHSDGQGGAWFYVETTENNTDRECVRVIVTPA